MDNHGQADFLRSVKSPQSVIQTMTSGETTRSNSLTTLKDPYFKREYAVQRPKEVDTHVRDR